MMMMMNVVFAMIILITDITHSTQISDGWSYSSKLDEWYTELDLCLLRNGSTIDIKTIMEGCENEMSTKSTKKVIPMRCRAGNSWPSKGAFCSPQDIPYNQRHSLRKSFFGFDDPAEQPLRELFSSLSKERGALLLVGDSVMQQFYSAIACELEREGIWTDPSRFKDANYPQMVDIGGQKGKKAVSVPIHYAPIYHYVNGRHDRVANVSMTNLRKAVDGLLADHSTLMIFMNQGLHYVSNPVAHFSKKDYEIQVTEALLYLESKRVEHLGKRRIRILWRETSAQHFPTPNGYWPGMKYASKMNMTCVPIADQRPESDWRNAVVREIIKKNKLDISIAPFYNQTVPLWTSHVNGHLQDCTHLCWSPMLYQPLFHFMANSMKFS